MPCASKTRHSSASAWPRSRACLAAVSTETTQSPRTVTSPNASAGNERTSVAASLPRHSALSARMCASVHSATESSTYDTPAGPPGNNARASDSSATQSARASASFAVFNNDSADLGSTSVEARTRASRSSADASASIGIASEPVTGGPPCSSTTSTSTSISAPSLGAVSEIRASASTRSSGSPSCVGALEASARQTTPASHGDRSWRGARRRAPACDGGSARGSRSRRVGAGDEGNASAGGEHRAMFDQRGASPTTPCVPRPRTRGARARKVSARAAHATRAAMLGRLLAG